MKYFIFSDVHGFYDELMLALNNAGFDKNNPEHVIVSLGDLLDRGPKPLQCLRFVNSIPSERKILIRGNHEDLMEEMIARRESRQNDWHNGTIQTALDLAGYGLTTFTEFDVFDVMRKHSDYNEYINSTIDYYEDDKRIFVHGWIPCLVSNSNRGTHIFEEDWRTSNWKFARWLNGMEVWNQGVKVDGKTVYCGHWHTSWGHSKLHKYGPEWDNKYSTNPDHRKAHFEPFYDDGICAIDACTAYSHKVNVVVVEE